MKSLLWLKIQSQWNRIIYDLRASTVLDSLMGKLVISFDDYERISKQETENDKARKLLQILKYKDDQHYDNFLAALDENEYGNIADAIREAKIPQASIELGEKPANSTTILSYIEKVLHTTSMEENLVKV